MAEPIGGYFAFSLRTNAAGAKNFHCQIAVDEGPAGSSVKVTGAQITQAVLGGITDVQVDNCTFRLANDRDETLEVAMIGRTVPKSGSPAQPFEASAKFPQFKSVPPPEELKGEGQFKEGAEEYAPRTALLTRELKAGGN